MAHWIVRRSPSDDAVLSRLNVNCSTGHNKLSSVWKYVVVHGRRFVWNAAGFSKQSSRSRCARGKTQMRTTPTGTILVHRCRKGLVNVRAALHPSRPHQPHRQATTDNNCQATAERLVILGRCHGAHHTSKRSIDRVGNTRHVSHGSD